MLYSICTKEEPTSKAFYYFGKIISLIAISATLLSLMVGCSSHERNKAQPGITGYSESGKASYYAMKYQFRKTANGERFNNFSMTAAHKKLPFGTWVIVTNLNNNKTVKVRINDRGPFVDGRIIDLTRTAFAKIESLDKGITEVEIRTVR